MKVIDNSILFYMRGDSFVDLAPNPVTTITNNGSVTVDTSQGPAFSFNGTSQALTIDGLTFSNILSSDYTIEFEAKQVSINQSYPTPFAIVLNDGGNTSQRSLYSHWMTANTLTFYDSTNPSTPREYNNSSLNTWYHVARVRQGNTLKTYVNGKLLYTNTNARNIYTGSNKLYLGAMAYSVSGTRFNGFVRNVVISNKVRYTGEFTPTFEKYVGLSISNISHLNDKLSFTVNKTTNNETFSKIDILINGVIVQTYTNLGSYEYTLNESNLQLFNNIEIRAYADSSLYVSEFIDYNKKNCEFISKDEPTLGVNNISYLRGDSYNDLTPNATNRVATNYETTISNNGYFGKGIQLGSTTGRLTMANGTSGVDWSKDFTIEWWEYSTGASSSSNPGFFLNRVTTGTNQKGLLLGYSSGTQIFMGNSGWNGFSGLTFKTKENNVWVHWRLVKSGTTWTMYKNGISHWTSTSSVTPSANDNGYSLGAWYDTTTHVGYNAIISEFAIFNTAICSGAFTPPTKPYTTVYIDKVNMIDNQLIVSVAKDSEAEVIEKVEYYVNSELVGTFTSDFDNLSHYIGMAYGRNNVEIRAYYYGEYYVSYKFNYIVDTIDKLNSSSSFNDINEKILELSGIYKSLTRQLADILISKNISVTTDEMKLFTLIEKVNELNPLE